MHYRARCNWYIYLGLILIAVVLVREVVVSGSQQRQDMDASANDLQNGRWSKKEEFHPGAVINRKSHPTARRVLGRAYTSPHTPYAVLPDFQRVAMPPTKPPIPFHFPHPNLTKTPEEIFSTVWVSKLHKILKSMPLQAAKEVTVVFSDSSYVESLLNWLIAARVKLKPPISNVLVVCLDKDVYDLLNKHEICSILIKRTTVLKPSLFRRQDSNHSHAMVIRMLLLRLINYFGYDVISYDTNAIPLRNLQPVFKKYGSNDIISSASRIPFSLSRAWGLTISTDVICFRSNANTELMWELMSSLHLKQASLDDQMRLNYAFRQCGIRWPPKNQAASRIKTSSITGQCILPPYQHVRITVLPEKSICHQCSRRGNYYVAHLYSKRDGRAKNQDMDHWFLARHWRSMEGDLKGTEWLADLANKSRLRH